MVVCRACGEPIEFRKTRNGKWCPYNPDGTVHWATCTGKHLYDAGALRRRYGFQAEATGGAGGPGGPDRPGSGERRG